jgi:hypothetical protein
MIMPTDKDIRAAMAEGLQAMVKKLPSYHPDLPTHRGYDILLLVRPHDQDDPQAMSNLMPEKAANLAAHFIASRKPHEEKDDHTRVTLAEYQHLTPEEKAKVTHIDARIVDDEQIREPLRETQRDDQWDRDHEDEGR